MSIRLRSSNLAIIRSIALTFDFTVTLRCASQLSLFGAARLSIKSEANEDEVKRVCAHNEHFRDYNALNKNVDFADNNHRNDIQDARIVWL